MKTKMTGLLGLGLAAALLVPAAPSSGAPRGAEIQPAVVVAIVEPGGFNVLHADFKLAPSQRLRLPDGLPPRVDVELARGPWGKQLYNIERGPLGDLKPGVLYSVRGTRILGIRATQDAAVTNIMEGRGHGTGTASSAVGLSHGTNPNAWLVFIPDVSEAAWRWVARQEWIDAVSTSFSRLTEDVCASRAPIARIAAQGRLVFSAIGNGEQAGSVLDPSGVPEAYQVGGVDEAGRPYMPVVSGSMPGTPNRPYETGDRFDSEAAHPSSLDDSDDFGGTSAAAPSSAGRAAALIQHARGLLNSATSLRGLLAKAARGTSVPRSGPLADGDLSAAELTDVLHAVAIPSLPASPLRYLYEGFGALNDDAIAHAQRILEGRVDMPERPEDEAMHDHVEALRALAMARC